MSWSVSAIGKPAAVAEKLAGDFARIPPMQEPEETGKKAAETAVAAIVPAFPDGHVVRVDCNGSQYTPDSSKHPDKKINQLTIKIETLGTILE
jgi:hypothetical protein